MLRRRIIRRVIGEVQRALFPTGNQKTVKRWHTDGGDYKLRFDYDLTSSSLVLDIGGYEGQWASDIFSRYCCRIVVFEPVSDFADRIYKRFSQNPSISVMRFGLGKASRTETISISKDGSSIFRESDKAERVEIVDVTDWIERQKISQIDLMKVNIEGAEYELIERLIETGLIRIVSNLQVQFHEISAESGKQMESIHSHLRETHSPTYQYRFVWENWTRNNGLLDKVAASADDVK